MRRFVFLLAALGATFGGGCAHRNVPATELSATVAPFSQSRAQTVALVAWAKHGLGPVDLNSLAVTYTALEEKANAYAHFLVDAVRLGSFDEAQNNRYAANLTAAIGTFNNAFGQLTLSKSPNATVSSAWVSPFAATMAADWQSYNAGLKTLPLQTKTDLIKELQLKTVWPNYENIATEPIAVPTH